MIVWHDAFVGRYESAWGMVQKLSWLNGDCPVGLLKGRLSVRNSPADPTYDHTRSFVDGYWLPRRNEFHNSVTRHCSDDIPAALRDRCGIATFGGRAPDLLSAKLRICPLCIRSGYHSIVHQLEGLVRCPIHAVALTDRCPRCRHPLGAFGFRKSPNGFRCRACWRSLLDDSALKIVSSDDRQREQEAIAPIVRWLGELDQVFIAWPTTTPFLRVAHQAIDGVLTNRQAYLWCLTQVRSCPVIESCIAGPVAGIHVKRVLPAGEFPAGDVDHSLADDTYKQQRHQIQATIESAEAEIRDQCSGHRQCLEDAQSVCRINFEYGSRVAKTNPTLCPVAQGFYIWRERALAFQRRIPAWRGRVTNEEFFDLLRSLKANLFSAFYGCIQSAALLKIRIESGSKSDLEYLSDWCDADVDPWLPFPLRPCHESGEFGRRGTGYYAVHLEDPEMLTIADCDHGAAMRDHVEFLRETCRVRRAPVANHLAC